MRVRESIAIVWCLSSAQVATAQRTVIHEAQAPNFVVRTIDLHHLTSKAAVELLSPYVRSPSGGVFAVSSTVQAVTVRETAPIVQEMMNLLSRYDREPANVTLSFQLIAAENSNSRDPAVAGLDSLLRAVLKFSGYRLLGTSMASAAEDGRVSQTIASNSQDTYDLNVDVSDLRIDGAKASVHLDVGLFRRMSPALSGRGTVVNPIVLRTGVTVPMGQTVVLGTSADSAGQRALILTVRPQLSSAKK